MGLDEERRLQYELLARILGAAIRIKTREDQLEQPCDLCTRVAQCVEADGGIFELIVNGNKFIISA